MYNCNQPILNICQILWIIETITLVITMIWQYMFIEYHRWLLPFIDKYLSYTIDDYIYIIIYSQIYC